MSELLLCRTASSLSHLFAEVPLLSAASSLRSLLSGLPLFSDPLLLPPSATSSLIYLLSGFCDPSLLFAQPVQNILQPPASTPHGTRVALCSKIVFLAAVTMCLATSSCNPACQERRSITHALLRAAVPMRFLSQPVEKPNRRNFTPNRPTFTQRCPERLSLYDL